MKLFLLISATVLLLASFCKNKKPKPSQAGNTLDLQAHRGGRGLMPENTIPAMKNAIDLGVTTLEMDAVISKDNKVVISHDVYFSDVITTTPEGGFLTKVTAPQRLLYTMPYDSIKKYDVGLKLHPDFPRQKKMSAYKPLLSDLIDSAEAHAKIKGRKIEYNIEIKSKEGSDGVRHPDPQNFSELVIGVLKDKKIMDRTTIQSFDIRPLQYIHKKYPAIRLSYLVEKPGELLQGQISRLGFIPAIYSPPLPLVTRDMVNQCHEKGMKVIVWTANTVEQMNSIIDMGVDGIISDYPDLFAQIKQRK